MIMAKATKAQMAEAKERLDGLLVPGDTVWTKMVHCSKSGMSRVIDLYVMRDNEPVRISFPAGILLEGYDRNHEGAKAGGCGMDMGFHLVYNLSYVLWPNGFVCIGKGCPSNDHSNGDTYYDPHPHKDGGYALNHRWM